MADQTPDRGEPLSGPQCVTDWGAVCRALAASGCDLTEHGRYLAGVPEESAEQDVRNALFIVTAAQQTGFALEASDVQAIRARLESAVRKMGAA